MKKALSIILVVAFLMVPVAALAKRGGAGGGKGGAINIPRGQWWNRAEVVQQLKLTNDQVERLGEIYTKHRKSQVKSRADLELVDIDLDQVIGSKKPDYAKAKDLVEKYESVRSKMSKERMMMLLEIRKTLTYDQYLQLKTIRRGKGREGGAGRGEKIAGRKSSVKKGAKTKK